MLFKLALQNIKKSIKDYAIYFFTLVLGVAIFYVFNALDSQAAVMQLSESASDIIHLMTEILGMVSVFVACVLGFLIVYASRFLMKRRSKEFGTYMLLGMSKRKVSMILFFETLMVGLLSLGVGLLLGVGVSQLMSIAIMNMFEADMSKFQFVFSEDACIRTAIYFGVMYLVVMIFNTITVSKCKLITLLTESKKGEKQKLKNPVLCIIVFILSAAVLSYAYYLVTDGLNGKSGGEIQEQVLLATALGVVSTLLIFWSLSGLVLRIAQSMKKFYYKGLNSFTLRQFSSQINTTVFSTTIICLMLFVTIVALSTCLTMANSMNEGIQKYAPVDVQVTNWRHEKAEEIADEMGPAARDEWLKLSKLDVVEKMDELDPDFMKHLQDFVIVNVYTTPELTMADTLGSVHDEMMERFPFLNLDSPETTMKVSDYNKVAEYLGNETYDLQPDEYIMVANFEGAETARNAALADDTEIELFGKTLRPKYSKCVDGFLEISAQAMNTGIVLVPDAVLEGHSPDYETFLGTYNTTNKDEIKQFEAKLEEAVNEVRQPGEHEGEYISAPPFFVTTKSELRESVVGVTAIATFVGLYLGLVFLTSVAAILALKELSESSDNRSRYGMLRKIGVDEKWINKALFVQIGIYFILPLIVAILHSVFGIKFAMKLLEGIGKDGLLPSIIMTGGFLVIIYGGYFLVTYYCSRNIIKERA